MSDPLVRAFFIGRAAAEAMGEKAEAAVTQLLSEIGRFDAEQRENLRNFTETVMERAVQEEEQATPQADPGSPVGAAVTATGDLQATIDDIRAEIAQLRAEMQRYRNRTAG
ncbi:MAG: DUF6825 family protein [Cyanobacteria bacterium P01_A01_bin.135]